MGSKEKAFWNSSSALGQLLFIFSKNFVPSRFNLANLYNKLGRNHEAELQLREIIEHQPDHGEANYSLGLLLAEMKRVEESADSLAKAAKLLPGRTRVRYNYALSLQHLGRSAEAEAEMLKAHRVNEQDPGIVYALATFYMKDRKWEQALPYTQKLAELAPDAPGPRQLLDQVRKKLSSNGEN